MVKYKLIKRGEKADIYTIITDDGSVLECFLESIDNINHVDKILALLAMIRKVGTLSNKEKLVVIKNSDVVELKPKPFRILTHRIKTTKKYKYIVLSGFKKTTDRRQTREINKAKELSVQITIGNATNISGG